MKKDNRCHERLTGISAERAANAYNKGALDLLSSNLLCKCGASVGAVVRLQSGDFKPTWHLPCKASAK